MRSKASDQDLLAAQTGLQRAALTLRAIRERYETGHDAHPFARRYSVNVAVDSGDMAWITAAIEAVEGALVSSDTSEAA